MKKSPQTNQETITKYSFHGLFINFSRHQFQSLLLLFLLTLTDECWMLDGACWMLDVGCVNAEIARKADCFAPLRSARNDKCVAFRSQ